MSDAESSARNSVAARRRHSDEYDESRNVRRRLRYEDAAAEPVQPQRSASSSPCVRHDEPYAATAAADTDGIMLLFDEAIDESYRRQRRPSDSRSSQPPQQSSSSATAGETYSSDPDSQPLLEEDVLRLAGDRRAGRPSNNAAANTTGRDTTYSDPDYSEPLLGEEVLRTALERRSQRRRAAVTTSASPPVITAPSASQSVSLSRATSEDFDLSDDEQRQLVAIFGDDTLIDRAIFDTAEQHDMRAALRLSDEYRTNLQLFAELYGGDVESDNSFSAYHPEAVRSWHAAVVASLCQAFASDGLGEAARLDSLRRDAKICVPSVADRVDTMSEQQLYEEINRRVEGEYLSLHSDRRSVRFDCAVYRDVYLAVARLVLVHRYANHCLRHQELINYAVRKLSPKQYATLLRRDHLKDRIPLRFGIFLRLMMKRGHLPEERNVDYRYRELMPSRLMDDYDSLFRWPLPRRVFDAAAKPETSAYSYTDDDGQPHAYEPNDSLLPSRHFTYSRREYCCLFNGQGSWDLLMRAINDSPYERSNAGSDYYVGAMKERRNRVHSFDRGAAESVRHRADEFADAGFFYNNYPAHLTCFACHGTLFGWHERSDPMLEHVRAFPRCPFVYERLVEPKVLQMWLVSKQRYRRLVPLLLLLLAQFLSPVSVHRSIFSDLFQKNLFRNLISMDRSGNVRPVVDLTFYRDPFSYHSETLYVTDPVEATRFSFEHEEVHGSVQRRVAPKDETSSNSSEPARCCAVCLSGAVRVVFVPCGHAVTCIRCSGRLTHCCVCRTAIETPLQLYYS